MKRLVLLLLLLSFACKDKNKEDVEVAQNEIQNNCSLETAERAILALPEMKAKERLVDSISKGKRGISFMSDSLEIEGKEVYELRAGYNSEIRFENYFTFYVDKNNCDNIRVADPVEGNIITLDAWRNASKELKGAANTLSDNSGCIETSGIGLPYNKTIDAKKVQYNILNCSIQGIDDFICDAQNKRYIALPDFKNVKVILVPMDCGDFNYRYYLLTIVENKLVSNLYVEGEWHEPEDDSYKEITSFSIDKDYVVSVVTNAIENGKTTLKEKTKIKIKDNGSLSKN